MVQVVQSLQQVHIDRSVGALEQQDARTGRMCPPKSKISSSGNGGRAGPQVGWRDWTVLWCRWLLPLRPRNPGLMSECILLPDYIHLTSLMVQKLPALIFIMIGNRCTEHGAFHAWAPPSGASVSGHIDQASPDTQIDEVGFAAIPELMDGTG